MLHVDSACWCCMLKLSIRKAHHPLPSRWHHRFRQWSFHLVKKLLAICLANCPDGRLDTLNAVYLGGTSFAFFTSVDCRSTWLSFYFFLSSIYHFVRLFSLITFLILSDGESVVLMMTMVATDCSCWKFQLESTHSIRLRCTLASDNRMG